MFTDEMLENCDIENISIERNSEIIAFDLIPNGDYPGREDDEKENISLVMSVMIFPSKGFADVLYNDDNTGERLAYEVINNLPEYKALLGAIAKHAYSIGNKDIVSVLERA